MHNNFSTINSSISQVPHDKEEAKPPKTQRIVQNFDDMMARSALFRLEKNIDNTQYVVSRQEETNRCFKQIESNSIRFIKKNNFDSKASSVSTLIRALRNERNINNR